MELKLLDKRVDIPQYATHGSAGVDLQAATHDVIALEPGKCELVPTGIALYIGVPTLAGLVLPRSGLGHKNGIILGNGTGLIDSDYQGEIKVSLWNRSNETFLIMPLMRIAQLVVVPVIQADFEIVQNFSRRTARGNGGFGSTGALISIAAEYLIAAQREVV